MPQAARLAELTACVGKGPFTADELASALVELHRPAALIRALSEALAPAAVAAVDDKDELDQALWGPAPTAGQLAAAREEAQAALDEALSVALTGALTRAQAGRRLGISPQAVSKRLAARRLISLERGREKRLPIWQFHDDGVLPGLPEVIEAWPGTALALTMWATAPSVDLGGRRPARALIGRGGVPRVLAAIEALTPSAW
jgi:hypothetical protein